MTSWQNQSARSLAERVELSGNGGQCKLRDSIEHYQGDTVATGTMFSVRAKQNIQIISFEFADLPVDKDLEVEIYTRAGGDYLSVVDQADQWTLIGATTAVPGPDGLGAIAPRADMLQNSISMAFDEIRSFYFTLKSQHLQVDDSKGTTDTTFASDDLLELNVGVSLPSYPFDAQIDRDRAFQGKIHYKAIQACANFGTSTKVTIAWAVGPKAEVRDVNEVFTDGILKVMEEDPRLRVMVDSHGLSLDGARSLKLGEQGEFSETTISVSDFNSIRMSDSWNVFNF
jgi:hypothetical protein